MNSSSTFTFAPAGERSPGSLHRIAIVGGGAGGLELAVRLGDDLGRRGKAEIVLLDPQPTHLWKPLLHEMAAGTLAPDEVAQDFLRQARRHHFRFHLGAMSSLDRRRKEVILEPLIDRDGGEIAPARLLWYDTLVIAIGSRENDFGIPGVRQHAYPLNAPADAEEFHRRLLALIARAEILGSGPVRVVIVGGGATGVELAAELTEATREIASYGTRISQYPEPVKITVVDNAPRLLAALPEVVGRKAEEDLRAMGVGLRLGMRVTEVRPDSVALSDGTADYALDSDMTVWAAGIRCPALLQDLDGLESNRLNQLVVTPTLQASLDGDVFALGDCASCIPVPDAPPVPPKAQAAHQEARLLARSLRRRLEGSSLLTFAYHDRGSVVSLGHEEAVGNLVDRTRGRTLFMEGILARLSYWMLYRRHLVILLGYKRTLLAIIAGWFAGRTQPRVKLH